MNTGTSSRTAWITGAGSGIGRAVAPGLLDDGWVVVLAGRRAAPLQLLARDAAARGHTALAVPTDVTQPDSVQALFAAPCTASKQAVTGLTRSIALDGRAFSVVASQVDIGNALTDLSERMTRGVLQANGMIAPEPMMDAKHLADAVRHVDALPLQTNVPNMTFMASAMPFAGRD